MEARSPGIHQGSEFIVRLPVAPTPGELSDHAPSSLEEHGTRGLRVLVVDDNLDGCTMLAAFLSLKGHAVATATSGPAAIATATEWRPDVVLLDIGLPGLSGYGVAERLNHAAGVRPFLVALTGYGQPQDIAKARQSGFDLHLLKPVDPKRLRDAMTAADGRDQTPSTRRE